MVTLSGRVAMDQPLVSDAMPVCRAFQSSVAALLAGRDGLA